MNAMANQRCSDESSLTALANSLIRNNTVQVCVRMQDIHFTVIYTCFSDYDGF